MFPLLFLLGSASTSSIVKMIQVWAEPTEYTVFESLTNWDTCKDTCYNAQDCVLVYLPSTSSGNCSLFRFGNVTKVAKLTSSSGKMVAFRGLTNSSTCPIASDAPMFGADAVTQTYFYNSQTIYNSTITSSDATWIITYTITICPDGSKAFVRTNASVCLRVRYFDDFACGLYSNATELCSTDGAISLSGPASDDEYYYAKTRVKMVTLEAAGCTTCGEWTRMWIDGISSETALEFVFADDTHGRDYYYMPYGWTLTNETGYCFLMNYQIQDFNCTQLASDPCFVGGFCRMKPV